MGLIFWTLSIYQAVKHTHRVSKAGSGFVFRWNRKIQELRLALSNGPTTVGSSRFPVPPKVGSFVGISEPGAMCSFQNSSHNYDLYRHRSPSVKLSVAFRSSHNQIINRKLKD
jgi:hypothetical protein